MSKDDDFEQMLDGLEIVAESLEEESHTAVSYTHLTLPTNREV